MAKVKSRVSNVIVLLFIYIAATESATKETSDGITPTEIVEISGKQNYEYKSIQKIYEPGTELKSGLYVFSPNKTFPIGFIYQ